jgi:hypothetical protein
MKMRVHLDSRLLAFVLAFACLVGTPAPARADLIINANFAGGSPPANMVGGGDLVTIFNTAISYWEAAFKDPSDQWVVNLQYQWAPSGPNAQFVLDSQGGTPHRIQSGTITFNNNGSTPWFADANPLDNSHYTQYQENSWQEPTGVLNVGRSFTGPIGDAVGRIDLLTIAEHEIGHALGLASDNTDSPKGDIIVTPPRPFPGLMILTIGGDHLAQSTAVMGGLFSPRDERVLISGLDVLAEAEISQFDTPNLDPFPAPEPDSATLLFVALIAAGVFHKTVGRRDPRLRATVGIALPALVLISIVFPSARVLTRLARHAR